jgi:hypothetical protein
MVEPTRRSVGFHSFALRILVKPFMTDFHRLILLIERLVDATHEVDVEPGLFSSDRFLEILENFLQPLSFDASAEREALATARRILRAPTEESAFLSAADPCTSLSKGVFDGA